MSRKSFSQLTPVIASWFFAGALLLAIGLAIWSVEVGEAQTGTVVFTVDAPYDGADANPGDGVCATATGACTLRAAVQEANQDADLNTIELPAGHYTLSITGGGEDQASSGDLDVREAVVVQGAGLASTIIDGGGVDRVFDVLVTGKMAISGVTIRNGGSNPDGGGIHSDGALTVTHSLLENNVSNRGGGILSHGSLLVQDTTFSGNTATTGGALYQSGGSIEINSSTFVNNTAGSDGGALFSDQGTMEVINSTVSGNHGVKSGGALATGTGNGPLVRFVNSTLAYNSSAKGANIRVWRGEVRLLNTILAYPLGDSNCSAHQNAILGSDGYNFADGNSCDPYFTATGDHSDIYPPPGNPNAPLLLEPLADNGGNTLTHRLPDGSPAINAGTCDPAMGVPPVDQRGVSRPQSTSCDIGAYERILAQTGPIFQVLDADDVDDGICDFDHCSLREAILAAQQYDNGATLEEIHFSIPGAGPHSIALASTLPTLTDPVVIDGFTQDPTQQSNSSRLIVIDGGNAVSSALTIDGDGITVTGLGITGFSGAAIIINGQSNTISGNLIYGNDGIGIDLGGDGVTPNDFGDADTGPNAQVNFPFIARTVLSTSASFEGSLIQGVYAGEQFTPTVPLVYTLEFYGSSSCGVNDRGQADYFLGSMPLQVDSDNPNASFTFEIPFDLPFVAENSFVSAIATDANGNTSEFSRCLSLGPGNEAWPMAKLLDSSSLGASASHYLDVPGQTRWYKFSVNPGEQVIVHLSNLPANYDVVVYRDINASFTELLTPATNTELVQLNAEFAGLEFDNNPDESRLHGAFSLDFLAGDFLAGDFLAGDFLAGDFLAGDFLAGDFLAGDFLAGDFLAGDFLAGDFLAGDFLAGDFLAGDFLAGDFLAGDFLAGDFLAGDLYSLAQLNSVVAVSAFNGSSDEGARVNTWDNSGDYYVRVSGRNGAFSLGQTFDLGVTVLSGGCSNVIPYETPIDWSNAVVHDAGYETVIVTDSSEFADTSVANTNVLTTSLESLANATNGVVIDLSQVMVDQISGTQTTTLTLNDYADQWPSCPYAENQVAYAIKEKIDSYRPDGLAYVVLAGNDRVVPYFRHKDGSQLANERDFVPPVLDNTSSQASLRLGYVLSQDRYGANVQLARGDHTVPVMDIPVGRLVETQTEIEGMIEVFLDPPTDIPGVTGPTGLVTPTTGLVTYYDFLADVGEAVAQELQLGMGPGATVGQAPTDTISVLGTPAGIPPNDPLSWSGDDMRRELLETRSNDLVFLAGHFSAFSALAADYDTVMTTDDVIASDQDLTNDIIFSNGCHSAYNTVDEHGVPGVTRQPDWPQAFAQKKAILIGGTGYQYGDSDTIELSERLYLRFTEQLRAQSNGPVDIGMALVQAKLKYLEEVPELSGIFEKSLLQATLYGLPMTKVSLPNATPYVDPADPSIVNSTSITASNGLTLTYATISYTPTFTRVTQPLSITVGLNAVDSVVASYLEGPDGASANPGEPFLPLWSPNVSVTGKVLRGVGFQSGDYLDYADEIPFTSAVATELGVPHAGFLAPNFFPGQLTKVNYFGALSDPDGATRLMATLAQYRTNPFTDTIPFSGTLRAYENVNLRLFYSDAQIGNAALAVPPSIVKVKTVPLANSIEVTATVVAAPDVGVQSVWISYYEEQPCEEPWATGGCTGSWSYIDLEQSSPDERLWTGTITGLSGNPLDYRLVAQAASWAGLVARADNYGAGFTPGVDPGFAGGAATLLALDNPPVSGTFGTEITVTAALTDTGFNAPLANKPLTFVLGNESVTALTGPDGRATTKIGLYTLPGDTDLRVYFSGDLTYNAASDEAAFTIVKQDTSLSLTVPITPAQSGANSGVFATLLDATGRPLREKTVLIVVDDPADGIPPYSIPLITQWQGLARLGAVPLISGTYQVTATFGTTATVGNQLLPLQDEAFNGSVATGTLVIEPKNTTISVSSNLIEIPAGATLIVTTTVDLTDSTSPVTATQVLYELYALDASGVPTGAAVYSETVAVVDSSGVTVISWDTDPNSGSPTAGLEGDFELRITVLGGYFAANNEATVIVNGKPVAADDPGYTTNEDTALVVSDPGVLANDTDPNSGDALAATLVSGPSNGLLTLNLDGGFVYTPALNFSGMDSFQYKVIDSFGNESNTATVTIIVNGAPECATATTSLDEIWPLNKNLRLVTVEVFDDDGDPVTVNIYRPGYLWVTQDEDPGGEADASQLDIHGNPLPSDTVRLRAEREGNGNGRVYRIYFEASDPNGASCSGVVRIATVPHDQSGPANIDLIDDGNINSWNSFTQEDLGPLPYLPQ